MINGGYGTALFLLICIAIVGIEEKFNISGKFIDILKHLTAGETARWNNKKHHYE